MFDKPGQLTFHRYKPFANDTASDVPSEEYIAIALAKQEKLPTDELNQANIFHRLIIDCEYAWSSFNIYRVYSQYSEDWEKLLKAALILEDKLNKNKVICEAHLVATPCKKNNRYCVIRLTHDKNMTCSHRSTVRARTH